MWDDLNLKTNFDPKEIFIVNVGSLEPPILKHSKTGSPNVAPADAFVLYFNFWYHLGLCPFLLRVCPETGKWKVITNRKQQVTMSELL